jgi:DNA repair exonuclease SbcCD nuclease subunit
MSRRAIDTYTAIITSDWHLDAVTCGVPRFNDVVSAVEQPIEAAKALGESCIFIFAGDLADPDSTSVHRCVEYAAATARVLDEYGVRSVWMRGNHDVVEDGSDKSTLSGLAGAFGSSSLVTVVEHPQSVRFGGKELLFLPYPSRARPCDFGNLLAGALHKSQRTRPFAVFAHLAVEGARMASESHDMARGKDHAFPWGDVGKAPPLLFNGHYHEGQTVKRLVEGEPVELHIPGSPVVFNFGEVENQPSYSVLRWSVTGTREPVLERVSIDARPGTHKLARVTEDTFTQLAKSGETPATGLGWIVRIDVPPDAHEDEVAAVRRRFPEARAVSVVRAQSSNQGIDKARATVEAKVSTDVRETIKKLAKERGGDELVEYVDGVCDEAGIA